MRFDFKKYYFWATLQWSRCDQLMSSCRRDFLIFSLENKKKKLYSLIYLGSNPHTLLKFYLIKI